MSTLELDSTTRAQPTLLNLLLEIRLEILRYCLSTSRTRTATWISPSIPADQYNGLLGKIRSRHAAYINPVSGHLASLSEGLTHEEVCYTVHPSLMAVCRQLKHEGRYILYRENRWLAVKWCGSVEIGNFKAYDIFEKLGLKTKWTLDSKRYGRILGRLKAEQQSWHSEDYMPSIIFTISGNRDNGEIRLIPLTDLQMVMRAFHLSFLAGGPSMSGQSKIRMRMATPMTQSDANMRQTLCRQILPWIALVTSDISFAGTDMDRMSAEGSWPAIKDMVSGFTESKNLPLALLQCEGIKRAVQQVEKLIYENRGHHTVVPTLFAILGQATDTFFPYHRLDAKGIREPLTRMSRVRIIAAWHLANLGPEWFNYSDDTAQNTMIAKSRHQLLLALFVKRSIKHHLPIKLPDQGHAWRIQVYLHIARLANKLECGSKAWNHFTKAMRMSQARKQAGELTESETESWLVNKVMVTCGRENWRDTDRSQVMREVLRRRIPCRIFDQLVLAWAEYRGYAETVDVSITMQQNAEGG
jgi:hypothetical protein